MLRPCVNLRTLGNRTTGVQRYLLGLLPHMRGELDSIRPSRAMQGAKGHLWEQFFLPTQLRRRLLWSPGNTGPIGVSHQVLTVHDAASLDHPEWFAPNFALWYSVMLPQLIRRVRAVITVSEFSRERILERTGVEPRHVHVILNGVDERFRPEDPKFVARVKSTCDLNAPYILFVGSLEPRKNLKVLFEAWRLGRFNGATLAVVGSSGKVFRRSDIDAVPPGVRLLGRVDDDALPSLYCGAAAFVYPSVYEGFGLPPLEAMACGCPVVVSDIPVHREVCAGAATYFDPFSPRDLATRIEWALRLDGASRAAVLQRGLEHSRLYRWKTAASQTWDVLERATDA